MIAFSWVAAAVSMIALVVALYSLARSRTAISEANNPTQVARLRKLVIEYDDQLRELQEKQSAAYARQAKRDKQLERTLAAVTPPETDENGSGPPESLSELRGRLIAAGRLGPRPR